MSGTYGPDYQTPVIPSNVRWAPGTAFGSIFWQGTITANTSQTINWDAPNDGNTYVLDRFFVLSNIIGDMGWSVSVAPNAAIPVYTILGSGSDHKSVNWDLFKFVSMTVGYPNRIQINIYNNNIFNRYCQVATTLYRYSGI